MWHTVWSSLPELISAGLKYTIPLAVISFALGARVGFDHGFDPYFTD